MTYDQSTRWNELFYQLRNGNWWEKPGHQKRYTTEERISAAEQMLQMLPLVDSQRRAGWKVEIEKRLRMLGVTR